MKVLKGYKTYDRFRVQYRLYGDKGPVIVCVNGAYQTMVVWQSFVKRFVKDYRILLFDYPGQGKSEICSLPFVVTFDEQVKILSQMVKFASEQHDVYLFGLSWGGVVAASYASQYPDTIKKLMLASFLAKPNGNLRNIINRGKSMVCRGKYRDIAGLMIDEFGQGLPEFIKRSTFNQFEGIPDSSLRALDEYTSWVDSVQSISDFIDLSKIKADTVIVNSDKDPIVDFGDVEDIAEKIPQKKVEIVKNAGHFLHLEDKNIFNIYNEFLESSKDESFKRYNTAYLKFRKK